VTVSRLYDCLDHILEAARRACSYVAGMTKGDFFLDPRTQQTVILNIVIIGEATTKLLRDYAEFLNRYPEVPWRSLKGMRNRLTHGYFEINLEVVWETVPTGLPDLLRQVSAIRGGATQDRNHGAS
jgi:uncharacterized protein with HEPN domain